MQKLTLTQTLEKCIISLLSREFTIYTVHSFIHSLYCNVIMIISKKLY